MSNYKRIAAVLAALLQIFWSTAVVAQATSEACAGGTSGQGSVLAVIDNGGITLGSAGDAGGRCAVNFLGGSTFDVKDGNLGYNGRQNGIKCTDGTTGTEIAGGASGMSRPTLVQPFPELPTTAAGSWSYEAKDNAAERDPSATYTNRAAATVNVNKYDVSVNNGFTLTLDATGKEYLKFHNITVNSNTTNKLVFVAPGVYYMNKLTVAAGVRVVIQGSGTVELRMWEAPSINGGTTCVNFDACDSIDAIKQLLTQANQAKSQAATAEANAKNATGTQKAQLEAEASTKSVQSKNLFKQISDLLGNEEPGRLQMNVYGGGATGNMDMQNNVFMSAGIYLDDNQGAGSGGVHGGNFTGGTGPLILVGQILGSNIAFQNNDETVYYNKPANMPGKVVTSPLAYALAPAAVPARTTTGTLIFRPLQRDVQTDGTEATSGDLVAVALTNKAAAGEIKWYAAEKQTLDTRRTALHTQIATPGGAATDFVPLTDSALVAEGAFGNSDAERIINPNAESGKYLDGRLATSLIGRPGYTQPIIVGKSVLFATEDGILYSLNRETGALQWGWIPRQMLPATAVRSTFSKSLPWGQLSTARLYDANNNAQTYVLGTAMQGQLHFSLKVSDDGDQLKGLAWQDYQANRYSPGSTLYAGGPVGGAAPASQIGDSSETAKVAYVVDNKLMVRRIEPVSLSGATAGLPGSASASIGGTGTSLPVMTSFTGAPVSAVGKEPQVSSNLLYLSDSEIYFGAKDVVAGNWRVYESTSAAVLTELKSADADGNKTDVTVAEKIVSIVGAPISSANGAGKVLLAQSLHSIVALKHLGFWNKAWTASAGDTPDATANIKIGSSSAETDPQITAPPSIMNGEVVIPVTRQTTTCGLAGKIAYMYGPVNLISGALDVGEMTYDMGTTATAWNKIGTGIATGISQTSFSPTGNDGSSKPTMVGSGSGDTSAVGNTNVGTKADEHSMQGGGLATKDRLNWRELTNFF